jgi:hypothetical protein
LDDDDFTTLGIGERPDERKGVAAGTDMVVIVKRKQERLIDLRVNF